MKDNLVIANNLPGSLSDMTKEEACPQYYSRYRIDGPPSVLQQPLLKIPKLFVVLRLHYLVCSSEIQRQSAQQARYCLASFPFLLLYPFTEKEGETQLRRLTEPLG